MNRRVIFVSAFAAVLMMSLVAFGQDRPRQRGPGGRGMGPAFLLNQEAVQKDLGITPEQAGKLKEVLEARPAGGGQRGQDMSEEEREKFRAEMEKFVAEQQKKIAGILDEKQLGRLTQIRRQWTGARAVASDEEFAKALSITDEQKEKIEKALQELRESSRDAGPGGFAEMREKSNAKVMEILTDEQKAKYKELLGQPFDTTQIRMGGPGGGRRGGN